MGAPENKLRLLAAGRQLRWTTHRKLISDAAYHA